MDDEVLWAFTRSQAEAAAGRPLTDAEAARVAAAIGFSTAPESCQDVVFAVCSSEEGS